MVYILSTLVPSTIAVLLYYCTLYVCVVCDVWCVRGYVGTWVRGYVGTWVRGYVGTWVLSCVLCSSFCVLCSVFCVMCPLVLYSI
jgi:hypothetical protein